VGCRRPLFYTDRRDTARGWAVLYCLGGPPRCGKSLLARAIGRETGLAVVSTDLLRGVLLPLLPALKDAMDAHDFEREADVFFPHLRQTALVLDLQLPDALIEGVGFLPRHAAALREELPGVRACFLGRSAMPAAALSAGPTDHRLYDRLSAEQRADLAARIVAWSAAIERECAALALPFVDLARSGFEAGLRAARAQLLADTGR
jgi:hypothetical protein